MATASASELATQIATAAAAAAGGRDTTTQNSNIRTADAKSLETKSGSGNR